eukprot:m51a1_g672 hypothetical protein (1159) ;mRNA; r:259522-264045
MDEDIADIVQRLTPLVDLYCARQTRSPTTSRPASRVGTPGGAPHDHALLGARPASAAKLKDHELLTALSRTHAAARLDAAQEILSRLNSPAMSDDMKRAIVPTGLRQLLAAVTSAAAEGEGELLLACVAVVECVATSPDPDALRQCGGCHVLAAALASADEVSQARILSLFKTLATAKGSLGHENKTAIVRAKVLAHMAHILEAASEELLVACLELLLRITSGASSDTALADIKVQEAAVKEGISAKCLYMAIAAESPRIQITSALLCKNLANCASFKKMATQKQVDALLGLLRVEDVYTTVIPRVYTGEEDTPRRRIAIKFQCTIMDILLMLAVLDAHKESIGTEGVRRLMAYLNPLPEIGYDVFQWNMDVHDRVLRLCAALIANARNREEFVRDGGVSYVGKILSITDLFSEQVVDTCAQVFTSLLNSNARPRCLEEIGIVVLIRMFRTLPGNLQLQKALLGTFSDLTRTAEGLETVFKEGGVQILHDMLRSENTDTLDRSMRVLERMSQEPFHAKVIRLVDSDKPALLQSLTAHCCVETTQLSGLRLLDNLYKDEGRKILVEDRKLYEDLMTCLVALCHSDIQTVQSAAFDLVLVFVSDASLLMLPKTTSSLAALLESAVSQPNAKYQAKACEFFSSLCMLCGVACCETLENAGLTDTIAALSRSSTATKPNSVVAEPLGRLLQAWRHVTSLYANADVAMSESARPPISLCLHELRSHDRHQFSASSDLIRVSVLRDKAAELIHAPNSTPLRLYAEDAGSYAELADDKALRQYVALRIKAGDAEVVLGVTDSSQDMKIPDELGDVEREELLRLVVFACDKAGIAASDALPMLRKSYRRERAKTSAAAAALTHHVAVVTRAASPEEGFSSLMYELQMRVSAAENKGFARHVDIEAEQRRRRAEREQAAKKGILEDVRSAGSRRCGKRLVSQDTVPGKELWRAGDGAYEAAVRDAAPTMARAVLALASQRESVAAWSSVCEWVGARMDAVQQSNAVQQLTRLGFSVVVSEFADVSAEGFASTGSEPRSVLRPESLPVRLLLELLEAAVLGRPAGTAAAAEVARRATSTSPAPAACSPRASQAAPAVQPLRSSCGAEALPLSPGGAVLPPERMLSPSEAEKARTPSPRASGVSPGGAGGWKLASPNVPPPRESFLARR